MATSESAAELAWSIASTASADSCLEVFAQELSDTDLSGESSVVEELSDTDLSGESSAVEELSDTDLSGESSVVEELSDTDLSGESSVVEELSVSLNPWISTVGVTAVGLAGSFGCASAAGSGGGALADTGMGGGRLGPSADESEAVGVTGGSGGGARGGAVSGGGAGGDALGADALEGGEAIGGVGSTDSGGGNAGIASSRSQFGQRIVDDVCLSVTTSTLPHSQVNFTETIPTQKDGQWMVNGRSK